MWQPEFAFGVHQPSRQPCGQYSAKRPLYFMAKPSAELAELIRGFSRSGRQRGPQLLHVTLLGLADLAYVPSDYVPLLLRIMSGFAADAFYVAFDSIQERRCVTLQGSKPSIGALAFQAGLARFLKSHGFPFFGDAPKPHLTINYRGDGRGEEKIDPVSWRVTELLLIESMVGEAEHREHGRWSLRV